MEESPTSPNHEDHDSKMPNQFSSIALLHYFLLSFHSKVHLVMSLDVSYDCSIFPKLELAISNLERNPEILSLETSTHCNHSHHDDFYGPKIQNSQFSYNYPILFCSFCQTSHRVSYVKTDLVKISQQQRPNLEFENRQ